MPVRGHFGRGHTCRRRTSWAALWWRPTIQMIPSYVHSTSTAAASPAFRKPRPILVSRLRTTAEGPPAPAESAHAAGAPRRVGTGSGQADRSWPAMRLKRDATRCGGQRSTPGRGRSRVILHSAAHEHCRDRRPPQSQLQPDRNELAAQPPRAKGAGGMQPAPADQVVGLTTRGSVRSPSDARSGQPAAGPPIRLFRRKDSARRTWQPDAGLEKPDCSALLDPGMVRPMIGGAALRGKSAADGHGRAESAWMGGAIRICHDSLHSRLPI